MTTGISLHKKEMIKEGIFDFSGRKKKTMKRTNIWINTIYFLSSEFSKLYLTVSKNYNNVCRENN